MYTGSSINPTINNTNNATLGQSIAKRPVGFAIIQVRNPEPMAIMSNTNITNNTGQELPQTTHNDIAKIIKILDPRVIQPQFLNGNINPLLQKDTVLSDNQPISEKQKLFDTNSDTNTDIGLAITTGLVGIITGMVIHNKLNPYDNITQKNSNSSKKEITNTVIKMMPELIKAVATGTTMIAASIGLSNYFNQESPEHLKVKLEALKK